MTGHGAYDRRPGDPDQPIRTSEAEPAPYVAKPADEDEPYVEVMPLSEWPGGEWRVVTREQADEMGIDWTAGRVPITRRTDRDETGRYLGVSALTPEGVTVEPRGLSDEQIRRVVALREARQTLGPPFGTAVDADGVTRVAEYVLTGLPAKAWPSAVLVPDGRPRRWATAALVAAIAALVLGVVALALVLA